MKKFIVVLALATFILVAITGASLAYFADNMQGNTILFKSGKLEVEINDSIAQIVSDWIPDKENLIRWSFINTGTKSAYIRAKIKRQWDLESKDETAWAGITIGENPDGIKYNNSGNPWRYIYLDSIPRSVYLYYGNKQIPIARAELALDESSMNLIVSVFIDDRWTLGKMHLHLTANPEDFTDLSPGKFKYKKDAGNGNSFTIPAKDILGESWDIDNTDIYAALHIEAFTANGAVDDNNTSWTLASNEPWMLGEDGYWYLCRPLLPGETADLSFVVKLLTVNDLIYDYKNAQYMIDLQMDYIQSSNDAISNVDDWSGHPLLQQK